MLSGIIKELKSPGSKFRGAPFWAWNGKLDEQTLREQIRQIKTMGFGGFFMHARVGLATPYLSEEWFSLIAACVDEARKNGLKAWLYDEDRWPSGAAGGLVTKNKKFRGKFIHFSLDKEFPPAPDSFEITRYAVKLHDENTITDYRRIKKNSKLKTDEHLLIFNMNILERGNSWFNGENYLDTLNPDAVAEFIKVTHEQYRKHFSSDFSKTIPGIFTDEPNIYAESPKNSLPWTEKLPEIFQKKFGYDLLDHLPELFFSFRPDIPAGYVLPGRRDFSKPLLDFRNLLADRISEVFSGSIGKWCNKNNMCHTGHVLREDGLVDQGQSSGCVMRFYEYMDAPGIDLLTEHWNVFNTAKQCSSVAHQFNRKMRLTESYGCTGWDFPFMGHKALGDWQYALGMNFRCLHLAWYTMEAEAKRDYPASIFHQSPWWKEYHYVEEYFVRLGVALSKGEEQRDLLVIHPMETCMGEYITIERYKGSTKKDTLWDIDFTDLTNQLLSIHIDFDFGDEGLMSRHGAVAGRRLKVGKAAYKAVLIPRVTTIRKTTLDLLETFANQGGRVFYIDTAPERLDGDLSPLPRQVFEKFQHITEAALDRVLSPVARHVSIYNESDAAEISPALYMLKKGRGFETLFVCNTGAYFSVIQKQASLVRDRKLRFPDGRIAWLIPEDYKIYQLDLNTGKVHRQPSERMMDTTTFDCPLEALESRVFFATAEKLAAEPPLKKFRPLKKTTPVANVPCKIELDEPNILVLDFPAYRIDGGKKNAATFCLELDSSLRKLLGTAPRGGKMIQPWLRKKYVPKRQLHLELEYTIECDTPPAADCKLALERPDLYRITFNGKDVAKDKCGYWCDKSIQTLNLPAALFKKGTNKLVLVSEYDETLPGLESLYLLGDFGVKNDRLTAPVKFLNFGDWTNQGLPYYAGNLIYHLDIPENCTQIEFPEWRGVALSVATNDSDDFKMIAWPPFAFRTNGAKHLRIKVSGHRRNAMGPFFLKDKWPVWTGPQQFLLRETAGRSIVPCGLLAAPLIDKK